MSVVSGLFGGLVGGKKESAPAPVAPPTVTQASSSTAVDTARRNAINARGRSASILTGELGVSGNTQGKKRLLGA